MTYEEALDELVTKDQAEKEIARHDVPGGFQQFLNEVGDRPEYLGKEVLAWLGY